MPQPIVIANDVLRVTIAAEGSGSQALSYHLDRIEFLVDGVWRTIARGLAGAEFATSRGSADASFCDTQRTETGGWRVRFTCRQREWEADSILELDPCKPELRRVQTYRFIHPCEAAIHPGLLVRENERIRYTYPLQVYEQPLAGLAPMRVNSAWAVPVPYHIWHDDQTLVIYGADRSSGGGGTLQFIPPNAEGDATLRTYLPDRDAPHQAFTAGQEVRLTEVIAVKPLHPGEDPLLEAVRLAAGVALAQPKEPCDLRAACDGQAEFFPRCQLWEPDGLAPGRGWFSNMWVHTTTGTPTKRGECSGMYDLGWGEGFGARTIAAMVRHWQRTGRQDLPPFIDEMSRNIECFRRPGDPTDAAAYYDRFHPPGTPSNLGRDARGLADFMGFKCVWTHCMGHIGYQLLLLHAESLDYPHEATREAWHTNAVSIARFLAARQKDDGDLQDTFDEQDREWNAKPHRIPARAAVCGLWARLGQATGDRDYIDRALRLARAVAPEIERCDFYNQMIDIHGDLPGLDAFETSDAENAVYAMEGLVELYEQTREPDILSLARRCAAYTLLWTYLYDLPTGYRGVTRGGTCCRMPDYPLIYLGASAQAIRPLTRLGELTGDPLYAQMAGEMIGCMARYRWDCPDKPWHNAIVHAVDQQTGHHWGPNREGQVDTGMTSGTSLLAMEYWINRQAKDHLAHHHEGKVTFTGLPHHAERVSTYD